MEFILNEDILKLINSNENNLFIQNSCFKSITKWFHTEFDQLTKEIQDSLETFCKNNLSIDAIGYLVARSPSLNHIKILCPLIKDYLNKVSHSI